MPKTKYGRVVRGKYSRGYVIRNSLISQKNINKEFFSDPDWVPSDFDQQMLDADEREDWISILSQHFPEKIKMGYAFRFKRGKIVAPVFSNPNHPLVRKVVNDRDYYSSDELDFTPRKKHAFTRTPSHRRLAVRADMELDFSGVNLSIQFFQESMNSIECDEAGDLKTSPKTISAVMDLNGFVQGAITPRKDAKRVMGNSANEIAKRVLGDESKNKGYEHSHLLPHHAGGQEDKENLLVATAGHNSARFALFELPCAQKQISLASKAGDMPPIHYTCATDVFVVNGEETAVEARELNTLQTASGVVRVELNAQDPRKPAAALTRMSSTLIQAALFGTPKKRSCDFVHRSDSSLSPAPSR